MNQTDKPSVSPEVEAVRTLAHSCATKRAQQLEEELVERLTDVTESFADEHSRWKRTMHFGREVGKDFLVDTASKVAMLFVGGVIVLICGHYHVLSRLAEFLAK